MPLSKYQGRVGPADLEIMRRVFDTVCEERRIALKDKVQRDELAAEVIRAFSSGATDEADLLRWSRGDRIAEKGSEPFARSIVCRKPFAVFTVASGGTQATKPVAFLAAGFL